MKEKKTGMSKTWNTKDKDELAQEAKSTEAKYAWEAGISGHRWNTLGQGGQSHRWKRMTARSGDQNRKRGEQQEIKQEVKPQKVKRRKHVPKLDETFDPFTSPLAPPSG